MDTRIETRRLVKLETLFEIFDLVTLRVSRKRREMYIGHSRLQYVCLCVFLSLAAFLQYCTHPDVTWAE